MPDYTLTIADTSHAHAPGSITLSQYLPGPYHIAVAVETTRFAISQYDGYNFGSMCQLDGGFYLGANSHGVFRLNTGGSFDNAQINARFRTPTSDYGDANQKRVRVAHVGFEADGELNLSIRNDEGNERTYALSPEGSEGLQGTAKVKAGRDGKGRYWDFEIENVEGSDFSVDRIEALFVLLGRKPSGS